jgi:hypothetical protein
MSGSEYLLWSYGQFEKMTFFPPDPLITRWDRGGTYGVTISRRLGWRMMRQKIKKINQIVVFGGRRTAILHNNQPKTCIPDGGGIIKDAQPDGYVRGARSHRFRGDQVGRRLKNEIK